MQCGNERSGQRFQGTCEDPAGPANACRLFLQHLARLPAQQSMLPPFSSRRQKAGKLDFAAWAINQVIRSGRPIAVSMKIMARGCRAPLHVHGDGLRLSSSLLCCGALSPQSSASLCLSVSLHFLHVTGFYSVTCRR